MPTGGPPRPESAGQGRGSGEQKLTTGSSFGETEHTHVLTAPRQFD
jgi:hypothetical protein